MQENLSGQRFADYQLISRIDGGTFGSVYLAEHIYTNETVVVKILRTPSEGNNPGENKFDWNEFIFEARIFRIEHPNIVRVKDFGLDRGRAFLVMEYMPRGNLRKLHPKGTRVPWDSVASYAIQIAQALQAVHDQGIVHRDLKPENLLVGPDGAILLGDFGIAIPSYTWDPNRVQMAKGTPTYIAPEQIKSMAVRQSDQYSLGIIMYELLTGSPPFVGLYEDVLESQLSVQPPSPCELVPSLSAAADELILRMLAKDPAQRFASMREFVVHLGRIQVSESPTSPQPQPAVAPLVTRIFKEEREGGIRTIAWSPDGQYIASAGTDKTVVVRDISSGVVVYAFHGHTDELWSVSWSPDSKYVASSGLDRTVHVWEATTGYSQTVYMEHQEPVRSVAWSPDGKYLASAGDDKTVQIWDSVTGMRVFTYQQHTAVVHSVAWSPVRPYLASGDSDANIHLWSLAGTIPTRICRGHLERVMCVAWSPNGEYVASASDDRSIRIWQAVTAQLRSVFTQHENVVATVAWSPDGKRLASGSWDKTVHIWSLDRSQALHVYRGHESWVNAVVWSPDGQYLASASWDNTAHIISL
ncbi:MAG: protein kinase domain-containing protein [Ktedonobacteraceae bacterium]